MANADGAWRMVVTGRPPGAESARPWLVLFVVAPPRGQELLLVDALRRLGARAVEPAGHRVAALFPPPASVDTLLWEVERSVRASTTLTDPDLAWRWQSRDEWARRWPTAVETRRVTSRLVVTQTSGTPDIGVGDVVIRLDPATAFGTAEHATTRGCLRFLDALVREGDEVVDIGTGSGILAIAAALLGARRVLALEADPIACEAARVNVGLNGVSDRVVVKPLEVTPRELARLARPGVPFGGVVANLDAGVLTPLLDAGAAIVDPCGWVVVSGVVEPERDQVLEAAGRAGLELCGETVEEAWWTGWLALEPSS